MSTRPTLFIGSSAERLAVAEAIQTSLDRHVEATIWNQGVFAPGHSSLESLVDATARFDFAIIVVDADDVAIQRGNQVSTPRDNVMFELGLFMGALGRERTLFIYNRDKKPALPSDLAGVTCLDYAERTDQNYVAALGPAMTTVKDIVRRLGFRDNRRMDKMEAQVEHMLKLLVSSRQVEFELIANKLGFLLPPDSLQKIRQDLEGLERTLAKG